MKAKKIRFLAGGLAAVMLMSNMTTTVVFADELDAPVQAEAPAQESYSEPAPAQESYSEPAPAQESYSEPAPAQESYSEPAPAQESYSEPAPAQESYSEPAHAQESYSEPAPAQESWSEPAPAPEFVPAPEDMFVSVPTSETTLPEVPAAVPEVPAAVPEVPAAAETPAEVGTAKAGNFEEEEIPKEVGTAKAGNFEEEQVPEEVGTAKAGNFDETCNTVEVTSSESPVSDETPEGIDQAALEKKAEEQAKRIDAENSEEEDVILMVAPADEKRPVAASVQEKEQASERKVQEVMEYNTRQRQNGQYVIKKTVYYDNGDIDEIWYLKDSKEVINERNYIKEKDPDADTETGKETARKRSEYYKAEQLREEMQGMTPDELVDYLTKLSTANAQNAKKGTAEENIAESDDGGNGFLDFLDDECKAVVNEAIKQAFDALPGSNFYGDPVQDLLKGAIGLNDDKKDMNEIIDAQHSETMKALEEMYLKMKENDVNANTLTEYGNRFDQFEVEAQERAKAVKAIQDRKDLSDKQKAVQIAAVIGSSLDWSQGKTALFEKMAYAAQTLKGNPKADPKGRNLYQVIYDFNKDYSMFSGEAMDRSEGYIKERINGFVRNCGVAIECLKAHHMVAKLTPEEVAALDPYTRGIYDQIKSDTSSISAKIKSITQIFTGNKDAENASEQTGAFDKVNEYYSQSRTVFINKGKSEVALESKLDAVGADEFEREYWAYGSDSKGFVPGDYLVTDVHSGYRYAETQALTKEQIDAIYKHCVENGWTISEYLCKIGFDLSLIYDVPDCSGAMLITGEQYYDNGWDEHKHGFYGYQIYGNAGKQKCFWKGFTVEGLFSDGGRDLNRKDQWKDGKDMAVLTFRKAGQEYYRDYFNNKYETEKR